MNSTHQELLDALKRKVSVLISSIELMKYTLPKETVFQTPAVALTYSNEGLSGASRNFHKWGRTYKLAQGRELRRLLLGKPK